MDFFFGSSQQPEQPDPSHTIDKLCDRVRDADLLEDRRSAVQGLRGLSREFQLQVGTKGMPALIGVLKADRMDVEIVKLTLETLNILCSKDGPSSQSGKADEDLGSMLAEIFVKDPSNIALLLDILSEVEFYVRFSTVTLLATLYDSVGDSLHEGILTSPLGVSRLIDLLDDKREIIRNEGLLLLIKLTSVNAEIQKIVAFENAFERLFSIIFEEGSIDGGIIVQDCLQLMQNLLRYNASNQNLFRETSCIKQIPKLLYSKKLSPRGDYIDIPLSDSSAQWSDQKETNTVFVLNLIRILVEGNNQNTTINQNLLGVGDLITLLLESAVEERLPATIRKHCLLSLADLIKGNESNRDQFGKKIVNITLIPEAAGLPVQKPPPGTPTPAKSAILQLGIEKGKTVYELRAAAVYTFMCYLEENPSEQERTINSLSISQSGPGSLLLSSIDDLELSRKDPHRCIFACKILYNCLYENSMAKDIATYTRYDEHGEQITLLNKVCYSLLRNGFDSKIQVGLLSLLSIWFYDNPKGVKEFLKEGSNVQFLVEQINQSSNVDPLVQGLSAFLYGIIYQFNDDSEPVFSKSNLYNLLQSRIGSDIFMSRVYRFKETKAFNRNDKVFFEEGEYFFDKVYQEFMRSYIDQISRHVTSKPKASSSAPSKAASPVKTTAPDPMLEKQLNEALQALSIKDADIVNLQNQLQSALSELQNIQYQYSQVSSNQDAYLAQEKLSALQNDYQLLEQDHDDLLLMMNDQSDEIEDLKNRLKAYGEVFSDEDDDQQDLQH